MHLQVLLCHSTHIHSCVLLVIGYSSQLPSLHQAQSQKIVLVMTARVQHFEQVSILLLHTTYMSGWLPEDVPNAPS